MPKPTARHVPDPNISSGPGLSSDSLRSLRPRDRIAAVVDADSIAALDAASAEPRPSPHLARWGINAHDDDGVLVVRAFLAQRQVLVAAQDERFLGGSVGVNHARALSALFAAARAERPAAVILLVASGGVRLHEANAAELGLARALSGLLDVRAAGVPIIAVGVGDVFGGASVMACAADRLALLPNTRLGLSGPRVIESAHGRGEVDASDSAAVDALFGAQARGEAGQVELVVDSALAVRSWIAFCIDGDRMTFAARLAADHARLGARLAAAGIRAAQAVKGVQLEALTADADPVDARGWLWKVREQRAWIACPAAPASFGPAETHAVDAALLALGGRSDTGSRGTIVIVEDSAGHEATRSAESLCVSHYLAHHAAVLAHLRALGFSLVGLLTGVGHSAAFFANALQAPLLFALADARVVAMDPAAIAKVTRLDPQRLSALIADDPLLGQPVNCLAHCDGVAGILDELNDSTLSALVGAAGRG